jgi:hypothetical protein
MQLIRTALTIALAANTANALPLCTSGDCANALEPNWDGFDAASVPHEKRSHTSAHPHANIGSHSNDVDDELSSDQRTEKEAMNNHHSPDTPQIKTYGQEVNALPTGQPDSVVHITMTPEFQFAGQDSAHSSGFDKMDSIQQNVMEAQHDNTANSANHSKNKMGFAVKVRELFKVFSHAQDQMSAEHQHQQEQNSENSVSTRQDRAQGNMPADRMHVDDEEQHAGAHQVQGSRYKTWRMHSASSSQQNQNSMSQAEGAREGMDHSNHNQEQEQENARPDAQHHSAMSQNRKHARSHTDRSGAHSQEMEQMNNEQTQHHEQHQEQQGQEQNSMKYLEEDGSKQHQQQMKSQSEMTRMECLRAAMGDVNKYVFLSPPQF